MVGKTGFYGARKVKKGICNLKDLQVKNLCSCWVCGSNAAALLTNAKNQFQVRCTKCGEHTKWERKTEAVIDWFNLFLYGKTYKDRLKDKA